jgi:hypothetical protein
MVRTPRDIQVGAQDVHRRVQHRGWDIESRRLTDPTKDPFNGGTREQFKLIVGEHCRIESQRRPAVRLPTRQPGPASARPAASTPGARRR